MRKKIKKLLNTPILKDPFKSIYEKGLKETGRWLKNSQKEDKHYFFTKKDIEARFIAFVCAEIISNPSKAKGKPFQEIEELAEKEFNNYIGKLYYLLNKTKISLPEFYKKANKKNSFTGDEIREITIHGTQKLIEELSKNGYRMDGEDIVDRFIKQSGTNAFFERRKKEFQDEKQTS
ncbi:TPA: hypothetical protein DEP21_02190 [Patescibacteria group bacterium]|nr:hypothetical protein [Candidatus Gracilibacteria bacterium]